MEPRKNTATALEWRVEAVSDAVRIVVGQGRKKVILARLCPPQISEHETWANARLMCAAPELLAAAAAAARALRGATTPEEKEAALRLLDAAAEKARPKE